MTAHPNAPIPSVRNVVLHVHGEDAPHEHADGDIAHAHGRGAVSEGRDPAGKGK